MAKKKKMKSVKHVPLSWYNESSKVQFPAGMAFWNTETGIYNIKLDIFSRMKIRLIPTGSVDDQVHYKVQIQKRGKDRQLKYLSIGEGVSSKDTKKLIFMKLAPFENTLILGRIV